MNILFDIGHPAHVHLLRNTYFNLIKDGYNVYVTTKDISSVIRLLELYNIPYFSFGKKHDGMLMKGLDQLRYDFRMWWFVMSKHVNVGVHGITVAHVSKFSPMKSILPDDDDDEVEPFFTKFAHPFADTVLTPSNIKRETSNAIYYNAFHELAYLHPNYFTPDINVLQDVGVEKGEPYFVLRFNAFKAHHDIGAEGLSIENKRRLVERLKSRGKVFITTERNIDDEFKPFQLTVSPEKIHSLLYFSTMFIGDSQTMTSEAAVLGTPAIKCNSFAGLLSVPNELEKKYGLCYSFLPNQIEAFFSKIEDLISLTDIKKEWNRRRQKMLSDKIDVTAFFTWFIENYPESRKIMKENPDYQYRFK